MAYAFDPDHAEITPNEEKLFAAHRNSDSKSKSGHKSRPILPAHMWVMLQRENGLILTKRQVVNWGIANIPKTSSEKNKSMRGTNGLPKNCRKMCHSRRKHHSVLDSRKIVECEKEKFKGGYWSQTAFIDMKSLRPMLPLQQIVQCQFDKITTTTHHRENMLIQKQN